MKFRDEIGQGASRTSPRRPGRYGAAYTEAEEDALIVFLAGKSEFDFSWADFTKSVSDHHKLLTKPECVAIQEPWPNKGSLEAALVWKQGAFTSACTGPWLRSAGGRVDLY